MMFKLREKPSLGLRFSAGALCVGIIFLVWLFSTNGAPEERLISPTVIGSPSETLSSLSSLWFDRALLRNIGVSMDRLIKGFGLAVLIGVPLGIVCGAWPILNAAIAPVSVFFRNIPMSAMLPLTLLWFGIGEGQKVMFIFVACVMFIMFDTVRAISGVGEAYVQSAKTLGANTFQILYKVLIPMASPDIFGSLRLLFGLATGYIVLAEMVNMSGGIGDLILTSQRQGPRDHVYLILFAVSIIAYLVDRSLTRLNVFLFPYKEQR